MDDANRNGNRSYRPADISDGISSGMNAPAVRSASGSGPADERGGRIPGINATPYLVIGWILAVASLVKCPYLFGAIAVIMGILANRNAGRGAMPLIVASIILMAAGLIFNEMFYNFLAKAFGI